jgi:hypothetical protein
MSFHHQSMTETWPVEWQETFDLVHSRFALAGAGMKDVREVVMNLIGLLKPGKGYVQLVEIDIDDPPTNGPAMKEFGQVFRDMLKFVTGGKGMDLKRDTKKWFQEAGLDDIGQQHFDIQVGKNARTEELQKLSIESITTTAQGLTGLLKRTYTQCKPCDDRADKFPQKCLR